MEDGILYLGTAGDPPVTAIYCVYDRGECAIIEPGPNSGARSVVEWVSRAGIGAEEVKYLVATHVHLDHAGASAALLKAYPRSRLVVYRGGAKHMIDPAQLVASASSVLGPFLEMWGGMPAVEPGRVVETAEGETIKVGGTDLHIVYSPGHAPYHMSVWARHRGSLFTGDAVGMYTEQTKTLWPASPPPSFRFDMQFDTLGKLARLGARRLLIPHYRPVEDADGFFRLNVNVYSRWHEVLAAAREEQSLEEVAKELVRSVEGYGWIPDAGLVWQTFKMHVAGFLQAERRSAGQGDSAR
ncbi:MAG: MBL fold metallo-hydrolase [Nitrososphaerota archaeon]|nr:MBL fold metallo-hydrolase [Nitrososphaerota archaeon]MDG6940135.1 MBL fold metallo-hydrolase [Nitrososphaerota archaeon]